MHRARAFFYVCAGIFLLALSYHLGARNAGAQSGAPIECASVNGDYSTAVIGRYVYTLSVSEGLKLMVTQPAPGTSPVIACGGGSVVLANGEMWKGYPFNEWSRVGTFPGVTPAQRESFGALKSRYRATPGAVQPSPEK